MYFFFFCNLLGGGGMPDFSTLFSDPELMAAMQVCLFSLRKK